MTVVKPNNNTEILREATCKICPECSAKFPLSEEFCNEHMAELEFYYEEIQTDNKDTIKDRPIESDDSVSEEVTEGTTDKKNPVDENTQNSGADSKPDKDEGSAEIDAEVEANTNTNEDLDEMLCEDIFDELDIDDEPSSNTDFDEHSESDSGFNTEDKQLLPYKLLSAGYTYTDRLKSTNFFDDILVSDSNGTEYILRLYSAGSLSSDDALKYLEQSNQALLDYGRDSIEAFHKDWELIKRQNGNVRSLRVDIANKTMDDIYAVKIAKKLTQFFALHTQGISFISAEPEFLSINAEGNLTLDFYGAVHNLLTKDDKVYLPRLENATTISNIYRAPELAEGMLAENSVVYSMGQIVAEAYFGKALSPSLIQTGDVPFHSIPNNALRYFLMGCLYPDSANRWSIQNAESLFTKNSCADFGSWSSLRKGASHHCLIIGSGDSAIECWSPDDLANAIQPESWDECLARTADILSWLNTTAEKGLSKRLRFALENGDISRDYVLVNLKRTITPNSPIIWRELSLSNRDLPNSLISLAQAVLEGNEKATERLQQLHKADLVTKTSSAFDVV